MYSKTPKFLQQEKPKSVTPDKPKQTDILKVDEIASNLSGEFKPLLGELVADFMRLAQIPLPKVCTAGEADKDKTKKGTSVKPKKTGEKEVQPVEAPVAALEVPSDESMTRRRSSLKPEEVNYLCLHALPKNFSIVCLY